MHPTLETPQLQLMVCCIILSSPISLESCPQSAFIAPGKKGDRQAEYKIQNDGKRKQRQRITVVARKPEVQLGGDFGAGDNAHYGGVLKHVDEIVDEGWNHQRDSLW